ncbi:hypothetical protein PV326_004733 [Microctonus aethiopoides]|nr:hypothetical protein PV326_004733 [Microctonus aethiopoides]
MSDDKTNKSIPALTIEVPDEADSFYKKYYNQPFYIDKTLLIKELFKEKHVLIIAPSRFGKSLNMDMMRRFVEIEVDKEGSPIELDVDEDNRCLKEVQPTSRNFKMFQRKNIFKEKEIMFEHFGKYPTIYVDFSEMTGDNFKEVVDSLKIIINRAFRKHRYLQHNPWWVYSEYNKKTFMRYYDTEECMSLSLAEIKAGFNNIKATYNGYKTNDSHNIDIYSPWAISKYICNKTLGVYWSAEIPPGIEEGIAHFKIRPKIAKIMSGESVRIKYVSTFHFKDVQRLYKIVCRNDMKNNDVDLFLQFLYELGFFHLTDYGDNYLCLAIPNKAVYDVIHPILNTNDLIKKYYNNSTKLIRNFIESLKNMARSCNENSARCLAKSIDVLFKKGRRTPSSEYEFHYVLYGYMLQEFECIASYRNRCDTLVWIEELHPVFVFEFKFMKLNSVAAHNQIIEKKYFTLSEKASLKENFPDNMSTVVKRIYSEIHMGKGGIVSITYSCNNTKEMKTVFSRSK